MIVGEFDERGRSYVKGVVHIPRLNVTGQIRFRLDTGADVTCLHPRDGRILRIPFDELEGDVGIRGVGGRSPYYAERALVFFNDSGAAAVYDLPLLIAKPDRGNKGLPSLLGLDIINRWYMEYDPANSRLEQPP